MSSNPFHSGTHDKSGLVRDMIPVTPDDSNDNVGGNVAIGLYVEAAGTVVFDNMDGITRTVALAANTNLTCSVRRVRSTGTTATGIHALIA